MSDLTKSEIAEAVATMWDRLEDGESDAEIMDLMGLDAETYNKLRKILLDTKTEEFKKRPIEHIYVDYVIHQTRNIGAVTAIYKAAKDDKQYNAAIAALRTRADLHDRLITKGQECGVFKKAPEQRPLTGTFMVADMTTEEIKLQFATAVAEMTRMMRRYGDHTIIDSPMPDIHYGEALPEESRTPAIVIAPKAKTGAATPSKTARAKTSKGSKHARGRKSFKVGSGGA